MNKKTAIMYLTITLFMGLLVFGGSYAYWTWTSNNEKRIVFNTAKDLQEYIIYDEGESKFVGDFKVSNTYTQGIHSTISISKTQEAANVDLVATIMMDVNSIGTNMAKSPALKWVVTSGDSTNVGTALANGNFIGVSNGDVLTLYPSIPVTTSVQKFTIWIWLDASANPSELLTGETLDTVVWTRIDQIEGVKSNFEITRINANYQTISATAVNSKNKITNYAVTTSDTEPTSWSNIATQDQANVYTLNHTVTSSGTYYVWFKDSEENTVSKSVVVNIVDSTGPTCTFDTFNPVLIKNGNTSVINLTCVDNESEIISSKLETSDLTLSNSNITLTNITKTSVTNGYKYAITVTGTSNNGTTTITLPASKIKNAVGLYNAAVSSGSITVANIYKIVLNNQNATSVGTEEVWYQYGQTKTINGTTCYYYTNISLTACLANGYTITKPTKTGYTFGGYYTGTNGSGTNYVNASGNFINSIYQKTPSQINSSYTDTITLYAKWNVNTYTIAYSMNGATAKAEESATIDVAKNIANPSKRFTVNINANSQGATIKNSGGTAVTSASANQTFAGWTSNSGAGLGSNAKIGTSSSGATTTWTGSATKNTYFKNLRDKSGTVTLTATWTAVNVTLPTVTKTGYTCGYAETSGGTIKYGSGSSYTPSTTTGNITLYAKCDAITYNISYNLDGGNASNPTSATYNTTIDISSPTKSGYIFTGWTSSAEAGLGIDAEYVIIENGTTSYNLWSGRITQATKFRNLRETAGTVTLTAQWLQNNYKNTTTNVSYVTLNDAFSNVGNNETIEVQNNVTEVSSATLANTKSGIKLNLNGKTIDLGENQLVNNGTLDIYSTVDNGTIRGEKAESSTANIINNGTMTTNGTSSEHVVRFHNYSSKAGVILLANTGNLVVNTKSLFEFQTNKSEGDGFREIIRLSGGTVNISGGTLKGTLGTMVVGIYCDYRAPSGTKLTMTSGTISTDIFGIYSNGSNANINISGGSISVSDFSAITIDAGSQSGALNISGGTFSGYRYGIQCSEGCNNATISNSTVNSEIGIGLSVGGNVNVIGGTINGKTNGISIKSSGTLTLGESGGTPSTTSPKVNSTDTTSTYYGVEINGTFNFYDGKITSTSGTGYALSGEPTTVETGYGVLKTTSGGTETAVLSQAYTVSFNVNSGSGSGYQTANVTAVYGAEMPTISTIAPTKEGYTFDGWYDTSASTGGTRYYNEAGLSARTWNKTQNATLYARWIPNTYTMLLDKGTGTSNGTPSITATYNSTLISPTTITLAQKVFTISGYELSATRKSDGATVSSTATLTSTATLNGYYSAGGVKVLEPNTTATWASNATNYTDASGNWISTSNNETLTAQFSAASAVTLPTITKSGYICGWTTESSGTTIEYDSGESITPSANTTLYGICKLKNYQNIDSNKYYESLSDAFADINNNQTIKVLNNVSESASATNTKDTVKLDLNGKILNMNTNAIINNSSLDIYTSASGGTLTGSNETLSVGVITNNETLTTNATSSTQAISIVNASTNANATVIVNNVKMILNTNTNVTFTNAIANASTNRYLVNNKGKLEVSGATLTNSISSTSNDGGIINNSDTAQTIMTSGSINTYGYGIYVNMSNSTNTNSVNISGGNIVSRNAVAIHNYTGNGTINISGGTISSRTSYTIYNYSTGIINISGGLINGNSSSKETISVGSGTLNMQNGTISGDYAAIAARSGIINISSGTVVSLKNGIIVTESGTITLGENDERVRTTTPLIQSTTMETGSYFGIDKGSNGTFNYYDGKITSRIGNTINISNASNNSDGTDNRPRGYTVQTTTTNELTTTILVSGASNVLMPATSIINGTDNGASTGVYLNTTIKRNRIRSIIFSKGTPCTADNSTCFDVSIFQNGAVTLRNNAGTITITAAKGVILPENSSSLFYNLTNLESVNFSGAIVTNIKNTSYMFFGCESLTTINLSPDTNNIQPLHAKSSITNYTQNAEGMFASCSSLTSITNLYESSNFSPQTSPTGSITNMNNMFLDNISLNNTTLNDILALCVTNTNNIASTNRNNTYLALDYEYARVSNLVYYTNYSQAGWSWITGYTN